MSREILWALVLAATAVGLAPCQEPPNLLIIQTDEHNFRTLGCYREQMTQEQAYMWGDAVVETPHIDRIAREGVLCTSFYATTPVCSPSRAALVTGQYPQNTPVVTNDVRLSDDVVTFAEVLRRAGYATGFAGKWHLDGKGKPQWAPRRKFGFEDNRYMFNRGHWKMLELTVEGPRVAGRNENGKPSYSVKGADETSFTTDFLTDRAIEFITEHQKQPFCYYLSLPDPHGPDTVRPPYDTMYKGLEFEHPRTFEVDEAEAPSWAKPAKKCTIGQAGYYGMVKCIDDNVGRLLTTLEELQLDRSTIVVFTSDHGDLRGEHHRHNKGNPYEGSARIPFVISWPGRIKAGAVVPEALTCVDFQPTILALMGVSPSGREEGRDASTLLRTGEPTEGWEDVAFLRGTGEPEASWLAAVTDRYKLVYATNGKPWLFDLETDPDELINRFLEPEYRDIVRQLSRALNHYAETHGDDRIRAPRITADIKWALGKEKNYPNKS